MGFSVSGAAAVLLVGLMVSVGTLYPVVEDGQQRVADARDAREERALDRQNARIDLVEATYDASADELTVTVENGGTTTLSVVATDLLVDGSYVPPNERAVAGVTGDVWAGGETLAFTVEYPANSTAPGRVVVVTDHGVADAEPVGVS
jgi:flagellar protein FlaF